MEFQRQVKILLRKRYIEMQTQKVETFAGNLLPSIFLSLEVYALYAAPPSREKGSLEVMLVPIIVTSFSQKLMIQIMHEKSNLLTESMRMMGLQLLPYWTSYLISDGIGLGLIVAFGTSLASSFGLFNNASVALIFLVYFISILSNVTFAFVFAATCDTSRTCTLVYTTVIMGLYIAYFVLDQSKHYTWIWQLLSCFLPPLGCQLAVGSFRSKYSGLPLFVILIILAMDIAIYHFLAYYLSEVWPSKYSVSKPLNFIFYTAFFQHPLFFYTFTQPSNPLTFQPVPNLISIDNSNVTSNETMNESIDGVQMNPIHTRFQSYNSITLDCNREVDVSPVDESKHHEITPSDSFQGSTTYTSEIFLAEQDIEPTIQIRDLRKTYGDKLVVNHVSFDMYEGQIFALLGHNGAGKSTLVNMLVGMMETDDICTGDAKVYGYSCRTENDDIRKSLGVCTQQDLLFTSLTVFEHLVFFLELKGCQREVAVDEANRLLNIFELAQRKDNKPTDLSGGEKRKLSVAIAICGDCKFIVLDEPTAGMDVEARRRLWDLLGQLRVGRTILLTTHYMDEASVLGDKVGIMAHGRMQVIGSPQYLKQKFGEGYQLILGRNSDQTAQQKDQLICKITSVIPSAVVATEITDDTQIGFKLSYEHQSQFSNLFELIESESSNFGIACIGLKSGSLEEVFFKLGGETPESFLSEEATTIYQEYFSQQDDVRTIIENDAFLLLQRLLVQIYAIMIRKLNYAQKDQYTWFLIGPIVFLSLISAVLYPLLILPDNIHIYTNSSIIPRSNATIDDDTFIDVIENSPRTILSNIFTILFYYMMFLGVPGIVGEFIVKERCEKLRSLLTVQGCSAVAYWCGSLLGDSTVLSIGLVLIVITWGISGMTDFETANYVALFIAYCFQLVTFSYAWSFIFTSVKSSMSTLTNLGLRLAFVPLVVITLGSMIYTSLQYFGYSDAPASTFAQMLVYGIVIFSPQYAFAIGLFNLLELPNLPVPCVNEVTCIMTAESILFILYAYHLDVIGYAAEKAQTDSAYDRDRLDPLSDDVKNERLEASAAYFHIDLNRINTTTSPTNLGQNVNNYDDIESYFEAGISAESLTDPSELIVHELRKIYPPGREFNVQTVLNAVQSSLTTTTDSATTALNQQLGNICAVENLSFHVKKGEIFGLLGANGAGKSTTISMITRDILPTAGDALISGTSVLVNFFKAASQLAVVFQSNALWEYLSIEEHLALFTRLKFIPERNLQEVVDTVLKQLHLTEHRKKLSKDLSGGMKRKLCVAMSLLGSSSVILLDEPCAGLDPLSRRNLRGLITACMKDRAVVLTTHSMEEADAMCKKIGIMAKGQLRAIGSRQHLKAVHGVYYEVIIKLNQCNDRKIQDLQYYLASVFPTAKLMNHHGGLLTFHVEKADVKMSIFFREMSGNKARLHIDHFSIDQPSLEQVFIETVTPYMYAAESRISPLSTQGRGVTSEPIPSLATSALNRNQTLLASETSNVEAESSDIDLYYIGKYNSFGCTSVSLKVMIWISTISTMLSLTLSFVYLKLSLIFFCICYMSVIVLCLLIAIYAWTQRKRLMNVFLQ